MNLILPIAHILVEAALIFLGGVGIGSLIGMLLADRLF
jgi:hypothetical protein